MDWLRKKKKEKQRLVQVRERGARFFEDLIECCDGKSNPIRFFSADQIIKATNNFSDSNLMSGLGEYISYSGKIDNHPMLFFRSRICWNWKSDTVSVLCRDIAISSMVSGHKNFSKLLGCCLEFEEPVIVHDFMKISFLDLDKVVSWRKRIKIAEDIATALAYLHTAFSRPFVYRALSLNSIVLGEDGVARLCDFSFCISIPQGETFVKVDSVTGTIGYIDENYMHNSTVSEKTDVYAIGTLMQCLLTGPRLFSAFREQYRDDSFGRWLIKSMVELRMDEIADPVMDEVGEEELRMDEIADPIMDEVGEEELCQMKAFLMLSMRCTGFTNREIPNMVEVAKELKNIHRSSFPSSASGESEIIIGIHRSISSQSSFSSCAS